MNTHQPAILRLAWSHLVLSSYGPPSSTTRLVLQSVLVAISQDGLVTNNLLVERSGLGLRAVQEHIKKSIELGWLACLAEYSEGRVLDVLIPESVPVKTHLASLF